METLNQREILKHFFVRPSVAITIAPERKNVCKSKFACISRRSIRIGNGLYQSTESDTSHISKIAILGSWAHRTFD